MQRTIFNLRLLAFAGESPLAVKNNGPAKAQSRKGRRKPEEKSELSLHLLFFTLAEELGVNLFYGGHYATETFGVKALAQHVARRFRLKWEFIEHPTGL